MHTASEELPSVKVDVAVGLHERPVILEYNNHCTSSRLDDPDDMNGEGPKLDCVVTSDDKFHEIFLV